MLMLDRQVPCHSLWQTVVNCGNSQCAAQGID